jgi:DNA invertase Pin-like site-specific DNA recombinase
MKSRYVRISTTNQSTARQEKTNIDEVTYIDKISGTVPFRERPQAKLLLQAITEGKTNYITVSSIDRLGRNTIDILTTIKYLQDMQVTVFVENLGLPSLINCKITPAFELLCSIMSTLSQMERTQMLERQQEGIAIAKLNGTYKGRDKGTTETKEQFLSKYPTVVNYLNKATPPTLKEIAKLSDVTISTVQKVKKQLSSSGPSLNITK